MRVMQEEVKVAVLKYNIEYQKKHGISPSFRNIQQALHMHSLATVQRYVKQLEIEGKLSCTKIGKIAPMPQLDKGETVLVPLVGQITCGEPNLGIEHIEESYALPKSMFENGELFMLRASGENMIEIGINKGDYLVIRKQDTAKDGEIAVANIDGENTLKRIYHRNGKIVLHPENKTMADIVVDRCAIQGVLVSCIKIY